MAIGMFLVVLPGVLVVLATRPPNEALLRRVAVTVHGYRASPPTRAAYGARWQRRRILGTVGGVLGLWATASWHSATSTWEGLLSAVGPDTAEIASGVGKLTLADGSFVLDLNLFGVLVGFAIGVVLAEWTGGVSSDKTHRAALLAQRDARQYVAGWLRRVLVISAGLALVVLPLATIAPNSDIGEPGSPWWAVVLIAVAGAALATRAAVLASAPHAATGDLLAAREVTRALTTATLTVIALAGFTGSTASSLARLSHRYGWGWGDGTATAAIALSLVATGLMIAAFVTPYWAMASDAAASEPSLAP